MSGNCEFGHCLNGAVASCETWYPTVVRESGERVSLSWKANYCEACVRSNADHARQAGALFYRDGELIVGPPVGDERSIAVEIMSHAFAEVAS